MQQVVTDRLNAAVTNLLAHCAGLETGQRLLVVGEESGAGYYDDLVASTVTRMAADRGLDATFVTEPFQEDVTGINSRITGYMEAADCTIFFARLGDQLRFRDMPPGSRVVVSYVLDLEALKSGFGTAHYRAFMELKQAIDAMMGKAQQIRVTCPRGTDFSGPGLAISDETKVDVSVIRFPMSVFAPVSAQKFSGRAVLAGFLMGTGSRYYHPYGRTLAGPVAAEFDRGRLTGFTGSPADVALANAHYDDIARRFDLDRNAVHSWHAGIHPGCAFHEAAEANFLRWSGGAFGNPRILHFHTCGSTPPGEISWNILDPTILVDGVAIWDGGQLFPDRIPGGADILAKYPCAAAAFASPEREVGVSDALPGLKDT